MTVLIWTDGACQGNPGPGGWAAVLKHGETERQIFGHEENTTNQQMEIRAAVEALNVLKRPCQVKLYSDSAYVVNCMMQGWMRNWQKNGWRTKDGKPVKNVALWRELDVASRNHQIQWIHVKGHAEDNGNNRADALAYAAARCAP
jgi:ribonuclease HI